MCFICALLLLFSFFPSIPSMLLQIACLLYKSTFKHCTCRITRCYLLLSRVQWVNVSTYIHYTSRIFNLPKYFAAASEWTHTRRNLFQVLRTTSNYIHTLYIYTYNSTFYIYTWHTYHRV